VMGHLSGKRLRGEVLGEAPSLGGPEDFTWALVRETPLPVRSPSTRGFQKWSGGSMVVESLSLCGSSEKWTWGASLPGTLRICMKGSRDGQLFL
jgi:hypothetical protein